MLVYKITGNLIDVNIPNFSTLSQINNIYSLMRHTRYLEKSNSN